MFFLFSLLAFLTLFQFSIGNVYLLDDLLITECVHSVKAYVNAIF